MQYRMHDFFPLEASDLMEELSPHILGSATFTEKTRYGKRSSRHPMGETQPHFLGFST